MRGLGVGRAVEAAGCAERREARALAAPGRCWVCTRDGRGRAVLTGGVPSSAELLPRRSCAEGGRRWNCRQAPSNDVTLGIRLFLGLGLLAAGKSPAGWPQEAREGERTRNKRATSQGRGS